MKVNRSRRIAGLVFGLLAFPLLASACRPDASVTARPSEASAQAEGEDATVEIEATNESSEARAESPDAEARAQTKTPNE